MLGTSPVGRRLLVPIGLAVAVAIWLLGSIHFQAQIPIVKRADVADALEPRSERTRTATAWTSARTCSRRSMGTRSAAWA